MLCKVLGPDAMKLVYTVAARAPLPHCADLATSNGYDSTIHYLYEMAKLVIEETGLLPMQMLALSLMKNCLVFVKSPLPRG